ncbi:MAG: zf-HC2 domain-containing protein [Gemmatimonadaceae bacterium]
MTDCPRGDIRDVLPDLVHGHLDPVQRAQVERHVAGCADCTAEVELLRAMRGVLDAGAPAVDVGKIVAAIRSAPVVTVVARPRRAFALSHGWRAAAAAIVISVGSLGVLFVSKTGTPPPDAPAGMTFGGGVSDIDAQDLKDLIGDVGKLDAVMPADPASLGEVSLSQGGER